MSKLSHTHRARRHITGHVLPIHDPFPEESGTFPVTSYALSPEAYQFAMNLIADLADGKIGTDVLRYQAQTFFERFDVPKPESE